MAIFPAHRSHYVIHDDTGAKRVTLTVAPGKPHSLEVPVSVAILDAAPVIVEPVILDGLQRTGQSIEVWTKAQGGVTSVLRTGTILRAHGTFPAAVSGYRTLAEFDFGANELRFRIQRLVAGVPVPLFTATAQGVATDTAALRFTAADDSGVTVLRLFRLVSGIWRKVVELTDTAFVGVAGQWALSVTAPTATAGDNVWFAALRLDTATATPRLPATETFDGDAWVTGPQLPAVDGFESPSWV